MTLPEEAILVRAVKDAIVFAADSDKNKVKKLYQDSLNAASEESGIELSGHQEVRKLYRRVFAAAVSALLAWDFDTDFEHT